MEDETLRTPSEPGFQIIDESLEYIFTTMISQGEVMDAVDFIRSIEAQFLPSTTIMKTLIFEILMKNDHIRTLAYTTSYLYAIIDDYPPINEERRNFYFDSIRDNHGFLADLWTVFNHIVNSYFIQRDIYVFDKEGSSSEPIKYPNCKFLLEFYLKLFVEDSKYYKSANSSSCLVMKLFWPNSDIRTICLSNRTDTLLKWINDIYSPAFVNNMPDLLGSMHEILTLVVRCIIEARYNLTEYTAFCSTPLAEIVESIINFCKDAFSNLANMKKFLISASLKYFRAKLCEKIIKQIIKVSPKKHFVVTLRDIVEQCMFPSKLGKLKTNNKSLVKKELRKRMMKEKNDMKMETTKLHELCQKNRFADLLEELASSSVDINARDPDGNTPLHLACLVNSRLCVRHLIDEGISQTTINSTLDFAAFNLEGTTPLHIAVMNNFLEIAEKLLSHGGAELLTLPDNRGQLPADLSTSDAMNKLLQEYEAKLKDSTELDSSSTDSKSKENHLSAPVLKSFKDYSIYLDALNCLLCTYCHIFNLYRYISQKDLVVSSHSDKVCCHFMGKGICSEDADIISEMPLLLQTFMDSIARNASKSDLNIDIELIPLKGFAASIKQGV